MKPGKLYFKISLSIIAVILVTFLVVFALFLFSPGKQFITRLEAQTKAKVLIVSAAIAEKIRSHPDVEISKNEALRNFIFDFAKILGAKIWLTQPGGTIVIQSFAGQIPPVTDELKKGLVRKYKGFKLYHRRHSNFYAVIPIQFPQAQTGSLHILFQLTGPPEPARGLFLALAVIGLIIGLLIIPISRFIIKPVKKLNRSALKIADGDLSHRAAVKSKDEIGELCRSFNHMADKLEQMIMGAKQLTANISHELRTPLARIHIAETLIREKLEKTDQEDMIRHLDDIRADIGQLDQLIGRILDLSKLDLHESPLQLEDIDPVDLMKKILARLKPAMAQKDLTLSTDFDFGLPFKADKNGLYSVFSNLLDNAVKFTPPKGHIWVEMGSEKDQLMVWVGNSFEALPEDDLKNIFEPFYRSSQTGKSGSGLGLAISRKIVEKHGGTIIAKNSADGFLLEISLPHN